MSVPASHAFTIPNLLYSLCQGMFLCNHMADKIHNQSGHPSYLLARIDGKPFNLLAVRSR